MSPDAAEILTIYEDRYNSDVWDLRPALAELYKLDKRSFQSGAYDLDFSPLVDSDISRELKLCILFILFKRHLQKAALYSNYIRWCNPFIQYLTLMYASGQLPDLSDLTSEDGESFTSYVQRTNYIGIQGRTFIKVLRTIWHDEFAAESYFDRDEWDAAKLGLSEGRYNRAIANHVLHFQDISNADNKLLFKQFLWHLFKETGISFSTVHARFSVLKPAIVYLDQTGAVNADKDIWISYLEKKADQGMKPETYNATVDALDYFYKYLISRNLCTFAPIRFHDYRQRYRYQYECDDLSDSVKRQLFAHLDSVPEKYRLMFLLIYYTGMRGSEAASFKLSGLIDFSGQKRIRYYQFKMKKEVEQPIPETLYKMLADYRERTLESNPDAVYFFARACGQQVFTANLRDSINDMVRKNDIRNEDGSPYHFRIHSLRHDFAMRMIKSGVPFLTVQNALHHASPEMTLTYARVEEETQKKRFQEFSSLPGTRLHSEAADDSSEENVLWMKHMIAQALPNGFCSLPTSLGNCPHANRCLFCDRFHTGREFLPVLQRQLDRTRQILRNNNCLERGSAKRIAKRLEELILEAGGAEIVSNYAGSN